MTSEEYGIKNYLNKHNIYKDDSDFQTVIINSFYNERGGDNDNSWKTKVKYVKEHFGKFCMYAHNNWKH